ncbi:MAG: GMC family oxidoreductase [Acidobacteria bacterium]|nr:GMC family oxidoreductase [Acidobacteriota bacterium]
MDPDVLVVGCGGGGAVVAKELGEAGARVVVLEAGPALDPDGDFSLLEDDMGSFIDGRLRWGPADRSRAPWVRRRNGAGPILQVAGVGGTTLHYNGISARAYPVAMDGAWPIRYRDLIPFYERVEEILPVRPVEELATKDALFAIGCERTGLARVESRDVSSAAWRPSPNAILPVARMPAGEPLRYPHVGGCTMCGHCLLGCAHPVGAPAAKKAKRATNVSYVPAALATGNCDVIPDAFATAVLFEGGRGRARARGVRWRDTETGEVREVEARSVVLAAGAIESARLWLLSGLPDCGGVAGRYLTTHHQDFVTGFFDREVHPDLGQVTMARADFPGEGALWSQGLGPQAFAAVVAGIGSGFWDDPVEGEPWDFAGRGWGRAAVRRLREYHRSLTVVVSTDDEGDPANGVSLSGDWPPDEHGAVPAVAYRPTVRTEERRSELARRAAGILRVAGAREVHRSGARAAPITHPMGTLRMGADPASSVVGPSGEAHEVERLFVADTSVFANGLGGANPTLTAQALATRTAGEILGRLA